MPVKPNIAVVGCGYWGPNLIRNFNGLPDCRVKTVCDADEARLNHIRTLYNGSIETTPSFERVLNDPEIQAVAIATPIRTHYELARRCLEAGKHAFVEKPLASSVDECRKLVALAEERGLTLMVGHTFIYTPAVRYIKKAIEDGVLGSIYYVSSQRLNLGLFQRDINVAWDLAPHDISILLYILQDVPKAINCQGKAHVVPGLEDITNISIDFNNGTFATVQSSWLDPNKIRKMTIVGSKAMIVYDDVEPNEKIRIYDKRVETPPHYDTFAEFQYSYHYGDMRVPYIRQVEPLKTECQHFLDCIATGARSESSGVEGLRVVQILEASSHSLRNGGSRIELPVE